MNAHTIDVTAAGGSVRDAHHASPAYVNYVIALVWLALLLRFVDLQIVAVLLEPIKAEFTLTDTQLGLLGGFAFSLFYGLLGIPIAWLADRTNRRNLIAAAVGLWSGMTALCGFASSFLWLFLARIGVGVGEGGGTPPTFSLLSDYVEPKKRATVFAIVNSSQPAGVFCGFLIGGWIAAQYGWRAAFWVAGVPGVLLALLIWLTMREPPRGYFEARSTTNPLPTREVMRYLWGIRSYRHMVLANTLVIMGASGSGIWLPSFFVRVHGFTLEEIATWLALIYGGGGTLGAIAGGILADRLSSGGKDVRWYTWVPAIAVISLLPFSLAVYLSPYPAVALAALTFGVMLLHAWLGPHHATVQGLAGARRRSMATAVNLLVVNVVGLGLGPLLVGSASDLLSPTWGAEGIRYSILCVVVVAFTWAALHFQLASRTLEKDLQRAQS